MTPDRPRSKEKEKNRHPALVKNQEMLPTIRQRTQVDDSCEYCPDARVLRESHTRYCLRYSSSSRGLCYILSPCLEAYLGSTCNAAWTFLDYHEIPNLFSSAQVLRMVYSSTTRRSAFLMGDLRTNPQIFNANSGVGQAIPRPMRLIEFPLAGLYIQ